LILTLHFNRSRERQKRKALRRNASEAEQRLWQHLRGKQLGIRFRRQYSVDAYVLDFYAPQSKLAIEVDGDAHFTGTAPQSDHERTTYLNRFGIDVLRFTNLDIVENIDGVLSAIAAAVKRRNSTSPLPPPWGTVDFLLPPFGKGGSGGICGGRTLDMRAQIPLDPPFSKGEARTRFHLSTLPGGRGTGGGRAALPFTTEPEMRHDRTYR
jgi:very-short-patch-repair endonuclease